MSGAWNSRVVGGSPNVGAAPWPAATSASTAMPACSATSACSATCACSGESGVWLTVSGSSALGTAGASVSDAGSPTGGTGAPVETGGVETAGVDDAAAAFLAFLREPKRRDRFFTPPSAPASVPLALLLSVFSFSTIAGALLDRRGPPHSGYSPLADAT